MRDVLKKISIACSDYVIKTISCCLTAMLSYTSSYVLESIEALLEEVAVVVAHLPEERIEE